MGTLVYTSMLNPRGGIECDFTVTRVAEDLFRVVTGTGFGTHDLAWIRSNAPDDGSVHVQDVSSSNVCLGLWGPAARDIPQPLTDLRLEMGYRVWGDITPDVIPYEAELGFAVKLEKGDFIGRDALVAQSSQPLSTKLACLLLKISARWLWGRSRCSTREANG